MPELKEKHYGYCKGVFAAERFGGSNRYPRYRVVNVETEAQIGEMMDNWDEDCYKVQELFNDSPPEPSTFVPRSEPTQRSDELPPVRSMGQTGDPF